MLTAILAMVQASFINNVYREINRLRRQNGLGRLQIDRTMEGIMRNIEYTENHDHSQFNNLAGKKSKFIRKFRKIRKHKLHIQNFHDVKLKNENGSWFSTHTRYTFF